MNARHIALLVMFAAGCAPSTDAPLPLGSESAACGSCHEDHLDEHATSPHGLSARSPILEAMLPEVEAEWGAFARDTCEGCHAPEHDPADDGITCVSCHAAIGNHAERDGQIALDTTRPIAGPFGDAEASPAHATRQSEFLMSASLCGTCHEITGPGLVDEPTLTEFRASPQAAAGMTCLDCHMPDGPERPISNDSERVRRTSSHRFVGFDPPWGASPEEAAAAAERTRTLLAAALELRIEPAEGGVDVVVRNVGAGHSVPTGATFLRDLWVDVTVGGRELLRVITLGDQPMRGTVPVPLLTRADHVEPGSLAPGEERRVFVESAEPVVAELRGRAVREEVLTALELNALGDAIPVHEIARAELSPGG